MTTAPRPVVTAVGRMLQPKHGEPQRCERIRVSYNPDGTVRETTRYEVIAEPLYTERGPRQAD